MQVLGKWDEVCGDPVQKRGFVGMTGQEKCQQNGVSRAVGDRAGDRTIGSYWRNERVVLRSAMSVPRSIDNTVQMRVILMLGPW